MSQAYSLTCSCGEVCPVEVRHAGTQITCSKCHSPLDVPKLRFLRELPPIQPTAATSRKKGGSWSRLQGNLFVLGILSLVIAAGSAAYTYHWRQRFDVPAPHVDDFRLPDINQIELRSSWDLWKSFRSVKLKDRPTPYFLVARKRLSVLDRYLQAYAVLGGIGAVLTVTSFLLRPR